jgi:hypothetical protein
MINDEQMYALSEIYRVNHRAKWQLCHFEIRFEGSDTCTAIVHYQFDNNVDRYCIFPDGTYRKF